MKTSYEITSSTQLMTKGGILGGVLVITSGVDDEDAAIIAYDVASAGDAAAGNKLYETTVAGEDHYGGVIFPFNVEFRNGLYVAISGTGASCIVYYKPGRY